MNRSMVFVLASLVVSACFERRASATEEFAMYVAITRPVGGSRYADRVGVIDSDGGLLPLLTVACDVPARKRVRVLRTSEGLATCGGRLLSADVVAWADSHAVIALSCDARSSAVLTADGRVWSWTDSGTFAYFKTCKSNGECFVESLASAGLAPPSSGIDGICGKVE